MYFISFPGHQFDVILCLQQSFLVLHQYGHPTIQNFSIFSFLDPRLGFDLCSQHPLGIRWKETKKKKFDIDIV